jgi:tetratricopeptide (TPR) repeat protein
MSRNALRGLASLVALASLACGDAPSPSAPPEQAASAAAPAKRRPARYVGAEACGSCHAEALGRWRGSDHDRAMQEASPETVLGDFSGVTFAHRGQSFRFERRDDRYWIHTVGADGEPRDFEVKYTFGVWPLQQYLVPLPGGRLQAVSAAWDSRSAQQGGQRWFHLPEDEAVPPGNALHWTGLAGSWNAMCAECHSTNLVKGYSPERDTYSPSWSAIDVSCEACHGPGSRHLEWAQRGEPGDGSRGLTNRLHDAHEWRFAPGRPIAQRVPAIAGRGEIDTCAPCHSRRSHIAAQPAPGAPLLDGYQPALIEPGLYFPDGQIRDEVYVWGSFLQSRMYAAGVVCSDCHDPHALRIERPDSACARCHAREVFASPEHHHHALDSPGASCVACHMPKRTYMEVDDRRDHGFRVPRPDLSLSIGVPNACSGCHGDRGDAWAAAATARWRAGSADRDRSFGEVFEAARRGAAGASADLAALARDPAQPAIVRASALRRLGALLDAESVPALLGGLEDPDALVRAAAAGAGEALAPPDRIVSLVPLLRDPVRLVRIEAARVLAPLGERIGDARRRRDLEAALGEYRNAQWLDADRPEARTNLGSLAARLGDVDEARRQYQAALRVGPFFVPAYVNLAELYRREGREDQAERVLREALTRAPEAADVHHALGLLLVRTGRTPEALTELARAAELSPQTPRYTYVYGIALHSVGEDERAIELMQAGLRSHPSDVQLLLALATLHRDLGRFDAAREYARRLLALRPADPDARALLQQLEGAGSG